MATLQTRNGSHRLLFQYAGTQMTFTIGRVSDAEARQWKAKAEHLLMRVEQGLLEVPPGVSLSDFIKHDAPWGEREWRALSARAALFARATDPAQVVLAPVNEAVFPDAAAWMPVRDRLLAAVRRAAPRHTLMWGGQEWGSWRSLLQTEPPADSNTLVEVHDYEGGDADAVAWRFGQVAAWRERHGQTVLVAELGGAVNHREDRAAWAADLRRSLPVLRRLRLPAALWAYTHGGHWRLQPGEGPALHAEFRAALAGGSSG